MILNKNLFTSICVAYRIIDAGTMIFKTFDGIVCNLLNFL